MFAACPQPKNIEGFGVGYHGVYIQTPDDVREMQRGCEVLDYDLFISSDTLTNATFPGLRKINGGLVVTASPQLLTMEFPDLKEVTDRVRLSELTSFNQSFFTFPNLRKLNRLTLTGLSSLASFYLFLDEVEVIEIWNNSALRNFELKMGTIPSSLHFRNDTKLESIDVFIQSDARPGNANETSLVLYELPSLQSSTIHGYNSYQRLDDQLLIFSVPPNASINFPSMKTIGSVSIGSLKGHNIKFPDLTTALQILFIDISELVQFPKLREIEMLYIQDSVFESLQIYNIESIKHFLVSNLTISTRRIELSWLKYMDLQSKIPREELNLPLSGIPVDHRLGIWINDTDIDRYALKLYPSRCSPKNEKSLIVEV